MSTKIILFFKRYGLPVRQRRENIIFAEIGRVYYICCRINFKVNMRNISKMTLLFTGILLSALLFLPCENAAAGRPGRKPGKTLRVLYWNIQNGMWAEQDSNYEKFVAWVKEKDPDICIFCEASTIYYSGTSTTMDKAQRYLPSNWGALAARYGHGYWFRSAQRDNYPQVITSKYPIDSVATFVGVSPDSLVVHGSCWTRIQARGMSQPLNLVSCHLKPFAYGYKIPKEKQEESAARFEGDQYRRKEVEWILKHTVGTREHPEKEFWFMAGDFNSRSRKDNYTYKLPDDSPTFMVHDFMTGDVSPYYDLVGEKYPGVFCQSHVSGRRIDYVYVTRRMLDACKAVQTKTDAYTTPVKSSDVGNFYIPSDHFPIIVDFSLKKLRK